MHSKRFVAALAAASALALPASAEAATYAETVLADNPLMYLRMGEPAGSSVAQDATPNDRDGAYVGSPALGVGGPFVDAGTAVSLTSTSRVTATVDQTSGSIELWVNPERLARGQQAGIAAHGNPAGDGWALGVGAKRKLAFVTGGVHLTSKVNLGSNVWTLLTVTWDNQKVRIYRNGVLAKFVNRNGAPPASSSHALVLGGNGAGAFTGSLNGKLDEVALYSQVLAPAQILAHFQSSLVPANTVLPKITGGLSVGSTLTVHPGTWSGSVSSRTYQWQRCDANGEDCGDIDGATGTTYVLTAADDCMTLQVAETATNGSGSSTAFSDTTGNVGPCPDPVPSNSTPPTISGTAAVGETLTANPGTWLDAAGATREYQWQRCDAGGANCGDISGATGTTYVVDAADDCMTLRVTETVTNTSGGASASSDATGDVGPCPDPAPSNSTPPTISGTATVGDTLTAGPGTWLDATGATQGYQWQRCDADGAGCADIDGATDTTYVLVAADECQTLKVSETMTTAAGAATATSDATAKVGPCAAPNPTPDPDPTPDPTPGPGTTDTTGTTVTPAGTTTTTGSGTGQETLNNASAGCVRLVAAPKSKKLKGIGKLRLKAAKNVCLTKAVKATVKPRKGMALKTVAYKLDGKKVKRVKKVKFRAKLAPAKLTAGKHTLKVRVVPRVGKAKTFKVRLRLMAS